MQKGDRVRVCLKGVFHSGIYPQGPSLYKQLQFAGVMEQSDPQVTLQATMSVVLNACTGAILKPAVRERFKSWP